MNLKAHFTLGLAVAIIVYLGYGIIPALIFFAGAFLIDIDHYVVFVFRTGSFSVKKAYHFFDVVVWNHFMKKKAKPNEYFFLPCHNIEWYITLALVSMIVPIVWFLFFGMLFHYLCDLVHDYWIFGRFVRSWSLFGHLLQKR